MSVTWQVVDEKYLNYLRENYESRIPRIDYGRNGYKPFFGSLFEMDEIIYVTQVSHPQDRHYRMSQNIDFLKVYHPKHHDLISVVNLNYMFPIHKSLINALKYKEVDKYRQFENDNEKSKYIDLLKSEISQINNLPVCKNAIKIYNLKYEYPDSKISQRCFDFKLLEKACNTYILLSSK